MVFEKSQSNPHMLQMPHYPEGRGILCGKKILQQRDSAGTFKSGAALLKPGTDKPKVRRKGTTLSERTTEKNLRKAVSTALGNPQYKLCGK
jgi:hypothetical protein